MSDFDFERDGKNDLLPPFARYDGQDSFFGGEPPLSEAVGYLVVLGFGFLFSFVTTMIVMADKFFTGTHSETSEHFK